MCLDTYLGRELVKRVRLNSIHSESVVRVDRSKAARHYNRLGDCKVSRIRTEELLASATRLNHLKHTRTNLLHSRDVGRKNTKVTRDGRDVHLRHLNTIVDGLHPVSKTITRPINLPSGGQRSSASVCHSQPQRNHGGHRQAARERGGSSKSEACAKPEQTPSWLVTNRKCTASEPSSLPGPRASTTAIGRVRDMTSLSPPRGTYALPSPPHV